MSSLSPEAPSRPWQPGLLGLAGRILLLVAAGMACGAVANLVHPNRIEWVKDWSHYIEAQAFEKGVPLVELKATRDIADSGSHIIFDARPTVDYEAGHIPGAFPLPYDEVSTFFDQYIGILTPEQPILTYCSGLDCDDALLLCVFLRGEGFTNTVMFAGGWEAWAKEAP